MSIFKCKMCGGSLEIGGNQSVAVCEYCGTKQTLPKIDDEKRANLYERANHFRRINEYDKAMEIYEQILSEENTDAEVYWSLVLCRYGIEYIEDPISHKRVPTVNRTQYASIYTDEDYKAALQYADGYQKVIYEEEAKTIDEIWKEIIAVSQEEEPFDVFICYKEIDNNGRRTPDSVLANELYYQLMQEGFRVFFARITLEDKIGSAYEPYIFAALNSAKVMIVLGTRPEYFNAIWVKNEWSRYLSLIKTNPKKILIPAYKNMDPYDLPKEFSHLQAQDMSKLGFMQDLIRGIKKIVSVEERTFAEKDPAATSVAGVTSETLLKRAFMFLEDGDFSSADKYCEKVLDMDPENSRAYLGKLMAQLSVRRKEELRDCKVSFEGENNYQKAVRFGDDVLVAELQEYVLYINRRNELIRKTTVYQNAKIRMGKAESEEDFKEAGESFAAIPGFKDADMLAEKCLEKAEVIRKEAIYTSAKKNMKYGFYDHALGLFQTISEWKDSGEQIIVCQRKIEILKEKEAEEKQREQKTKRWIKIIASIVIIGFLLGIIVKNEVQYRQAKEIYGEEFCEAVQNAYKGDKIVFGTYEQDGNIENGKEEIEWIVLAKSWKGVLLISKYALDSKMFDDNSGEWDSSDIRLWLNNDFLNSAFTETEQKLIQLTDTSHRSNPENEEPSGDRTSDRVFLLSIDEVEDYFEFYTDRKCIATEYAIKQSVNQDEDNNNECWWWLRSPGRGIPFEASVDYRGEIVYGGCYSYLDHIGVRPALWIHL